MNIIGKKNLYFTISLLVIIPGIISLFLFGLNLSIDFTGGSRIIVSQQGKITKGELSQMTSILQSEGVKVSTSQTTSSTPRDQAIFRTSLLSPKIHAKIISDLQKTIPLLKEDAFDSIGPTIGSETTANAVKGIVIASILIVLFIAWSFRQVPKPASSWRFGMCAIIALLHDVLVVVGIFSILGHFFGVEVDSLFVTAVLTVIGFSVHDTIVVFDRIRENLKRTNNTRFSAVVNSSILQTLGRSLNTSLTVLLVLLALLFFAGESTRLFIVALLIGILSGTYSSIFNAAPLLVVWHEISSEKKSSLS